MNITVGIPESLPPRLFDDLGCYRHRVFVERMGWQLQAEDGLEFDQFDRADTVYVVARGARGQVVGCARLLPTLRPYLLADVFPQLLHGAPAPRCSTVWELSRFAAVDLDLASAEIGSNAAFSSPAAVRLLRAALNSASERGGRELITVSPLGVERLLRKAGFQADRFAPPCSVQGRSLFACRIAVTASTQVLQ
jgi:acyl homoserine lactone synthase